MDTSMTALTRTINQIGETFEAFKATNDERLEAVKSGNDSLAGELSPSSARSRATSPNGRSSSAISRPSRS